MKENLLRVSISILVLVAIITFSTASAAGGTQPFGGRIVNTKATEIQSMESSNYKCVVPGETITIKSNDSTDPTTYFISSGTKSKTKTTPRAGQKIKGLYSQSKTTITCIYQGYPPNTETVQLNTITLYGTSKK